ncbi:MAG TPA: hypothetical protein VFB13_09725 [Reyranella sp.]|jgi:hypothetical protein|nr:hypothetical protein [Reyranella sp.]
MTSTSMLDHEAAATTAHQPSTHLPGHYLSWGGIVAGAICAAAISILLFAFGSGIGLTAVSPWPNSGLSPVVLAIIGAIWVAIVQVVGFGAGGYVAGRVRNSWSAVAVHERRFRDGMHGFVTWALGLLIGALFAAVAAGGLLHSGLQAGAMVAAGAMNGQNGSQASQPSAGDYGFDYLMRPAPQAGGQAAQPASWGDVKPSVVRVFADNLKAGRLPDRDRSYLASLVAQRTGMSQADAEKRVDEAFAEAKNADTKLRAAADKARKTSALAAFLAAATLVVGCAAACAAAGAGGRHRDEQTEIRLWGTRRFW